MNKIEVAARIAAASVFLTGPARAGLVGEPTADTVNGAVAIGFELQAATDVEVSILDRDGRIVRHLAAGALGADRPPPAPLQPGLEQTLAWDGKGDDGQPARGGPFQARIRTDLQPTFDRFIGAAPEHQGNPVTLGCGPEGQVYVLSRWSAPNRHYPGTDLKKFDRDGRYVRQVMPYPASLPPEKLTGIEQIETRDGSTLPLVQHGNNHSLYPEFGTTLRQSLLVRPDGKLVTVNARMGDGPYGFDHGQRRAIVLGSDGSVGDDYLGPRIGRAAWQGGAYIMLALSPDGETLYAAGYRDRGRPVPVVTRTTWDAEGEPEIFAGDPENAGAEPAGLIEPRGMAVDPEGRLYVCDNAADRVAIFTPDGELAGTIPAPNPDMVAVHRKTGEIFVLTVQPDPDRNRHRTRWTQGHNWSQGKRILKFENAQATEPIATLDLPSSPVRTFFALDDSQPQGVLWLAQYSYGDRAVKRTVDQGNTFSPLEQPIRDRLREERLPIGYLSFTVDPHTEEVWVGRYEGAHNWRGRPSARRFDGRTGAYQGLVSFQSEVTRPGWGEIEFSADGQTLLYQSTWPEMFRFERSGRPAPWPDREPNEFEPNQVAGEIRQSFMNPRGLDGAADGSFYVLHHAGRRSWRDGRVSRVGPNGDVAQPDLVRTDVPVGGVRVGREGHIYVGVHLKPAGQLLPDWFEIFARGHLVSPPDAPDGWGTEPGQIPPAVAPWYVEQYGSVVRFKPEGGALVYEEDGPWFSPKVGGERGGWAPNWRDAEGSIRAEGVDWIWYGLAPMPSRRGTSRSVAGPRCSCQTPRFGLDAHERLHLPDPFRFGVAILDAAGNLITRFGQYGNQDDSAEGTAIPFAWPHAVATTPEAVYIADMANHRLVRVRLEAASENRVALPQP